MTGVGTRRPLSPIPSALSQKALHMTTKSTSSGGILTRISLSMWVGIVVAVLALIFVFQNRESATVDFFWVSVRAPQWFTLLMVFLVGWITGVLMMRGRAKRTTVQEKV
jgi:lipopolysaccharide assembly protein A